jgi:23S rRNA pseudouridine2605 synthase
VVNELGFKVTEDDEVAVDGRVISEAKKYTMLFHKPAGVVTTLNDPQGRPTIARYLPNYGVQLKPVGRLDMDTDGLLIVTNDGDLALRITHPRYGLEKEYQAIVEGIPEEREMDRLRRGVMIEGGKTAPAKAEYVFVDEKKMTTSIRITIHEGKKRQVRQMCDAIGHPVIRLTRLRIGPFFLRGLQPGECRLLGKVEMDQLRRMVGLD